ncbi:MAG: hypothetical protein NTY19_40975 [Planctomycetota bacterium]|nr:hypothetical protein [Planctomycetota bacterium]
MRVSPILVLLPLLLMAIPQVGALVATEAETTAATPQPVDMKKTLLNSFEDDAVLATLGTRQARLALSDQHATAGHTSLEVVFGVADYPNVSLRAEKLLTVTDWRPYGALLFDAYSPDEKPLRVSVRIDDSTNHNWTTGVELPPRRQVRVALVLRLPKTGMRGYPMSAACQADLSGYFWQTTFDLGNIASFQFFLDHPKQERTVFIDNLQLTEIPPLTNIVDRYGQFTRADWPGKIHVDRDLIDCQFQAQAVRLPGTRNAALETDMKELLSEFAQRYYATVAALMKKHAPHQLYLGSRFSAVPPDEVALASAKHCDVVSYNIYGRTDTLVSRGRQIALFDRPVLIGEFHFGALDRGMFHGGMVGVSSQEERGVQYAEYIQTALAQPWCVGAHWFTYGDEMLTGRGDGENFNIGFVSVADVPYPELVSRASEINAEIYRLRGRMAK